MVSEFRLEALLPSYSHFVCQSPPANPLCKGIRSASDHICLYPRRPNINTPADQREPGLPPYLPELQMPPEAILNYNQTVLSVKGITTGKQYMSRTIALSFIEFSIQRSSLRLLRIPRWSAWKNEGGVGQGPPKGHLGRGFKWTDVFFCLDKGGNAGPSGPKEIHVSWCIWPTWHEALWAVVSGSWWCIDWPI